MPARHVSCFSCFCRLSQWSTNCGMFKSFHSYVRRDSIMADTGFNVQYLFACQDIAINIPSFFKKNNRMSGDNVQSDRKISSNRVHTERAIRLAKTDKMLTQPFNHTEMELATKIIFMYFILCNFRDRIVSRDAWH